VPDRQPDRHKHHPKAVRMPDGMEAWLAEYATQAGRTVNAVIVEALSEYRARRSWSGAGREVWHKDGDATNNDPGNLEIRTSASSSGDRI
jgi:predicted transcriptional regulator